MTCLMPWTHCFKPAEKAKSEVDAEVEYINQAWRHLSAHYQSRDGGEYSAHNLPTARMYRRMCKAFKERLLCK